MKTISDMIQKINSVVKSDQKIADMLSKDGEKIAQSVVCSWKNEIHKTTSAERYFKVLSLYKKLNRKHHFDD